MTKMNRRSFVKGAAIGAVAAPLAAPALAQERIEMAIVATWGRDFPGLGTGAQRYAQTIQDLSGGRIQVSYYAAGERVGAFDSFDEVASGNAQGYHAADYYWKGRHPGWGYFTAVPFGLTYSEMNAWIRHGGGQELWDELAGEFGLKCIMAGSTGTQAGGWFNKEINSADDFNGVKMRIPGLGGDVIGKLGGSPVTVPGGLIYENLVSGAIDATEWVGAWNDEIMKFYEAAKYYYYPGMHEPASQLAAGFNASFWGSLSDVDTMGQNDTPVFVVHGTADRTVLYSKSEDLYARGQATNTPVQLHGFQGRGHSWSAIDAYKDSINGRPIVDVMIDWIGDVIADRRPATLKTMN